MNRLSEYDIRTNKIQTLRAMYINPFAQTWEQHHRIGEIHATYQDITHETQAQA